MKLKVEDVSDALVTPPLWPTAHWYPLLLQLLVQYRILLPQCDELLSRQFRLSSSFDQHLVNYTCVKDILHLRAFIS